MVRGRAWLLPVAVTSVAALLIRVIYLAESADNPFRRHLGLDLEVYDRWAREIAGGGGLGEAPFTQAPFFPLMLGLTYALLGPDPEKALWLQLLPAVLTVALTAWTAARLHGTAAAWIGGGLLALYAPAIFLGGVLLPSTWSACLAALFFALSVRGTETPSPLARSRAAAIGGVAGLLLVAQPTLLGLLAPLSASLRRGRRLALPLLGGLALPLLGTLLWNGLAGGAWTPIAVNRGINLYIGNGPEANGAYVRPSDLREDRDLIGLRAAAVRLAREGAVQPGSAVSAARADAYWTRAALAAIAHDPLRAAALFGTKLGFLAAQYEIPQVESMRFESRFSRLLRLPLPGMALLLGLAALGAVLALGRNDSAGVEGGRCTRDLLLGLGCSAAFICLFFVTGRFRLALVPSLAILASATVSAWPVVSPTRRIVAVATSGLAIVVSLLGARSIDAATSDGQFLFRLGVIAEKEQDLALAKEHYAAAIAIDPNEAKARINLGTLLAREGRLEEARPLLERGVALDPLSSLGRISLGQLELVTGHPAEAIRWYGEAAALDPESPLAREGLVFANYDRGQVARDDLEALLRLAPQGSPIAQRARNLAYLLESRAPLASAAWLGSAPLRAADLLFVRGRLEQARAAYTSLRDDPAAGEAARLALARLAR